MSDKKPIGSVSFAPTPPFVRAFGEKEAARQQALFERPSWAKDAPCTPRSHEEADDKIFMAFVCGASAGMLCGAIVAYVLFSPR